MTDTLPIKKSKQVETQTQYSTTNKINLRNTVTNTLAVKKSEQVETQIEYSTKIGKQVLKSQLQQRFDIAVENVLKANETYKEHKSFWQESTAEFLESKNNLSIANDGEITRLRNLINRFTEHKFNNNLQMIHSNNCKFVARDIFYHEFDLKKSQEKQEKTAKKGTVTVSADFKIAIPLDVNEENLRLDCDEFEFLGYELEIPLSDEILQGLKTSLIYYRDTLDAEKHLENIKQQIKNIDQVVEQMEAQLLVNELGSTEEGKKVLEVTSKLVAQMLGDTPSMLKLDE